MPVFLLPETNQNMEKKEPNYRGYKAMPFVIGNESCEKLGTIGISSNLIVYLVMVFNMSSIRAINIINVFTGTCNFGTLIGAFIADTYLGRYHTIGIACVSSFFGMLVLTMTALLPSMHPFPCQTNTAVCGGASPGQLAFLFLSFALLIIGASGIRPCSLPFGVDQFNPNTDDGKKGIHSFFNWYYLTLTVAMMISLTIIIYIQSNISWSIGFGIPTLLMLLGCIVFFIGTKIYVIVSPEGSPLTSMVQTLVVAVKKRKLMIPEEPWRSLFNHIPNDSINVELPYTDQLRCLNKAAILAPEDKISGDGSAAEPWKLRSLQQVEQTKCVIKAIPIWIPGVIYFLVLTQMQTYTVLQSIQCDRRFGAGNFKIPPGAYVVFSWAAVTLWILIHNQFFTPILRRITGNPEGITLLQRMGTGLIISVFAMLVSALVETRRREIAFTRATLGVVPQKGDISAMSANWLIPQLVIAGISEAFFAIGLLEFLYRQFPENMKSFSVSMFFCGFGLSYYLNSFLVSAVHATTNWLPDDLNHGRLDYFFYLIAGIETVTFFYFAVCAARYVHKAPVAKC